MTNLVLEYIKTHDDWEYELATAPYNLKISYYGEYVLFKYDQINSDLSIPLVQQARGMIIDTDLKECVCWPFDKFFNHGEPNAAQIDWSTASVQEKIDGSLMKVWYSDDMWHLSTNGTINAFMAVANSASAYSFGSLFLKAIGCSNNLEFQYWCNDHEFNHGYTYMFELVSPFTRVVIPYEETAVYYLGCRNNSNGVEHRGEYIDAEDLRRPQTFPLTSLEECITAAEKYDWTHEGFVVCDASFRRVKVKSPAYIMAHYARTNGNVSKQNLIKIVLAGEMAEFLTYANEYRDAIRKIECDITAMQWQAAAADYIMTVLPKDKPAFAKALKARNYPKWLEAYFFKYHTQPLTFEEFTKNWPLPRWERALEESES